MPKKVSNNKGHPKMLAQVLQAVADLKEIRGSTARKIVDQVQTVLSVGNIQPKRNVVMQVRRALCHGVETGILKERAGKYRIFLRPSNITPLTKFSDKLKTGLSIQAERGIRTTRRRRSRSRRRRRRRRRSRSRRRNARSTIRSRRSMSRSPTSCSSYTSATTEATIYPSMPATVDSSRRRRRKGRRRRRRRSRRRKSRRRSRHSSSEYAPSKAPQGEDENSANNHKNIRTQKARYPHRQDAYNLENKVECDNPDCICNLKQEPEEERNVPERRRHEDDVQGGPEDYIN